MTFASVKSELKTYKHFFVVDFATFLPKKPICRPMWHNFFEWFLLFRNGQLPSLSEVVTESENTHNKKFSVLFSFMTVFAVETRGCQGYLGRFAMQNVSTTVFV